MASGLNEDDIKKLVLDFFAHADASAPVSWFLPLIDDSFHMVWTPTCQFDGPAGFVEFYRNLTRNLFDRVHVVSDIKAEIDGDKANVTFVIHLTAKAWYPPMPKALHGENEAHFHWVLQKKPGTEAIVITSYTLQSVSFPEGSIIIDADKVFKDPSFQYGPFAFP